MNRYFKHLACGLAAGLALPFMAAQSAAAQSPPVADLVTDEFVTELRTFLEVPIIIEAIEMQNNMRASITQEDILKLDDTWRAEVGHEGDQPLITLAIGGPASTYLLRQQASSKGLFSEIFVMDKNGLNVAQSSITSDYWQGDEAKFQKTFPVGPSAVFIDEPEFNDEYGIWVVQVNLTLSREGRPIGTSTVEINLTELDRRSQRGLF